MLVQCASYLKLFHGKDFAESNNNNSILFITLLSLINAEIYKILLRIRVLATEITTTCRLKMPGCQFTKVGQILAGHTHIHTDTHTKYNIYQKVKKERGSNYT